MHVLMLTPDAQMIDRRILQEARTLTAAGYRVTLLAGFECRQPERFDHDGVEVHRFVYDWDDERLKKIRALLPAGERLQGLVNRGFMFLARRFLPVGSFERFVLEQARRFPADIIHVHDLPMLQTGVTLSRERQAPLVYDAHEIYPSQNVMPPAVQQRCYRMERRLIRHADRVITVNECIANLMQDRYRIDRLAVICNAAEIRNLVDEADPILREAVGREGPIVLFQGWLSAERNIETVVRAMAHVPESVNLAIIGYGQHEEVLRQLTQNLGVQEQVHFLGAVPSEEILRYTRDADLGVIPYLPIDENHVYCSPNKFFEFVVSGVPVLTHRLPFLESMGWRYGVVHCTDFSSPKEVGREITRLLGSDDLDQMRRSCHEAARVLNWSTEGKKLLALYGRLGTKRDHSLVA